MLRAMWREYLHDREMRTLRVARLARRRRGGDASLVPALLWQAPVDRPRGRRGMRAPLAGLALVAAPMVFMQFQWGGDPGQLWGGGEATVEYRLDGPAWVQPTLAASAGALLAGAPLLWLARHPALVAVGLGLIVLAPAAFVFALVARSDAGRISRAELRSVGVGTPRDDVTRALGAPAGHGTERRRGVRRPCLVYVDTTPRRWEEEERRAAFCFEGNRVAYRSLP
jgi:hypothetical protein